MTLKRIIFSILAILLIGPQLIYAQNTYLESVSKIGAVLKRIESDYVDKQDLSALTDSTIRALLNNLDPHSTYSNSQETSRFLETIDGQFSGIGIRFAMVNDTLIVSGIIPGGPSEKAGLRSGDQILRADNHQLSGRKITTDSIIPVLRGAKGSIVNLQILRDERTTPLIVKVKRDDIAQSSVDCAYVIDSIGYFSLNAFTQTSIQDVRRVLSSFEQKGVKSLIIDLQNNGGGLLQAAVYISSFFLPTQTPIVAVRNNRTPIREEVFRSQEPWAYYAQMPIVVLVNEFSASASEIFAGAMQDCDRALIIGRRTFGKGLVQRPYFLPDKSMVRLTTARYYTPVGRSIQKPYKPGSRQDYEQEIVRRFEHGETIHADSIGFADSLKYKTLHKKRVVYGGGGIMPDVFVPTDTIRFNPLLNQIIGDGILLKRIIAYSQQERATILRQYPDYQSFVGWVMPDTFKQTILDLIAHKVTDYDAKQLANCQENLFAIIKAELARQIYGSSAFLYYYNRINPTYQQAVKMLRAGAVHYDPVHYLSYEIESKS